MKQKMTFVFGSNLAGIHGAGAARFANRKLGAVWGVGEGPTGECYALPTKGHKIENLSLSKINFHIKKFLDHAANNLDKDYKVTCVGTGLAVWDHKDIAPLFEDAPRNCYFDELWRPFLGDKVEYWGTF